jgi:hypothetical protein
MQWVECKVRLPINGQRVWYYGPHFGVWRGKFEIDKSEDGKSMARKFGVPTDLFVCDEALGVVDSDDAPYWMPYEEGAERPTKPEVK